MCSVPVRMNSVKLHVQKEKGKRTGNSKLCKGERRSDIVGC